MRINRTFAKCALALSMQVTAFLGCAAWVGSANHPQQAAARPVLGATARELAAVIVSGDTVGIDGRTYRSEVIQPAPVTWPSCGRELAAIREVSSQAGIGLGASYLPPSPAGTSPATWARELQRAGDLASATAARHIHSAATARRFIADMEHDASVATSRDGCRS